MLFNALTEEGLEVATVMDGEGVLDLLVCDEPDLILLDVLMPVLDRFETCRDDPATRNIPVIFMTALVETNVRIEGFRVGAVDYVTKPFETNELLARVRTQISLRLATRALEQQNVRLSQEVGERVTAQDALAEALRELRDANEQLSLELRQRERAEAARAALQEQIIAVQRERLADLSAPLIPITEGLLVIPLVGTIDVERAEQTVETALHGAAERGADYLILDITGVKTVDETVAGMLVQAARGLELLGTRAIITGVRAGVAQTLVRLSLPSTRW